PSTSEPAARVDDFGGADERYVAVGSPLDAKGSTLGVGGHSAVGGALERPCYCRRARAGPRREGMTPAPPPHPDAHRGTIEDFNKLDIGPIGKDRMMFD